MQSIGESFTLDSSWDMASKRRQQRTLIDSIAKKFSISNYDDWYKLTPQQIRSEVSTKYKLHELLQKKYPNVDWKVYKFQIRPRHFWRTPSYTRQFFLDVVKELKLSKFPDDLYMIQMSHLEKFGGRSLFAVHDSYVDSIIQSFPEYELKPWLFSKAAANKVFWRNKAYQEQFLRDMEKKHDIKEPMDWYRICISDVEKHGGSGLLDFYDRSLQNALAILYPDMKWYPWLFPSVPSNYWDKKENQRAFMEYLATQLKYSNWEGFYTLTYKQITEYGGAGLLESKYMNSIFKAVTSILSGTPICKSYKVEHPWEAWKFNHIPKGFWEKQENRILYFDDLAKKLQIKQLDDWYNWSNIDILPYQGFLQMMSYFGTISKALSETYPNHAWKPWLFKRRVRNLWEDIAVCKQAFDWASKRLGVEDLNDWYYVSRQDLMGLGLLIPVELHGGLPSLLSKLYPEREWKADNTFYHPKVHVQLARQIKQVVALANESVK